MTTRRALAGLAVLGLALSETGEALPLRIRPRISLPLRTGVGLRPGASLLSRPRSALAQRRRARVERQEATLGTNPARRDKDTGVENPDHVRNQEHLETQAEAMARESGDQLVGPAFAYYRTSRGRLVRATPNAGTGNLRHTARLRPGESLARLEQVGYATSKGNGILRVSAENHGSRLGLLGGRGQNWLRATGGILGTAAIIFGKDVARWIGIRNSADAIQDRVGPKEPEQGPEIVIDGEGKIHIDGDGDGRQELEVQGQQGGAQVQGEGGSSVVVDQGAIRVGEDEAGEPEIRIDPDAPEASSPYGLP